ncbi:radical SAM protein [Candidatus Woesearchaeota archaeon]|nr:radical SAM protein [Candidatus Woesearchaeota archaeon]
MLFTILDCYTDEPSGLGVPPYIGTYPRYIAGAVAEQKQEYEYLTIDDIRYYVLAKTDKEKIKKLEKAKKTNILVKNRTKSLQEIEQILVKTKVMIVIAGIHTPGKYLSAQPGTVAELNRLLPAVKKQLKKFRATKILTGPATIASGLYGGRKATFSRGLFDLIVPNIEFKLADLINNRFEEDVQKDFNYSDLRKIAILGAEIVKKHPDYPEFVIAEIETSRGCFRDSACGFCIEPRKGEAEFRDQKDIIDEMKALSRKKIANFRLGKQTCIYSYKRTAAELEKLLKGIRDNVKLNVLHVDNANPARVTEKKTKLLVNYCTSGNVAAFGIESFDPAVVEKNNLNSTPEQAYEAVKIINKHGAKPGSNGLPRFLPGINILFGLTGETKKTNEENMAWLKKILENGLLLRRINVREVVIFQGTMMAAAGEEVLKKNKRYYWKWRDKIRKEIDNPMLKKLTPVGTVMKDVRTEVHDGNYTFGRQIGTYPLIVGIKQKLKLNEFVDVNVTGHMLRSVVGSVAKP